MDRMNELVELLNRASVEYYENNNEIMSDKEFDKLYDELVELEKTENRALENSPTKNVGSLSSSETVDSLKKVTHNEKMLSLDKTKEVSKLEEFCKDEECVLSFKMDGLTVILSYEDGKLISAVTRGNGVFGEDIIHNAKVFKNIPTTISYKGNLTIRGEAVIKFSSFEKINEKLEAENKYKNPRNLVSGTVRSLNNKVVSDRQVFFYAFSLVNYAEIDFDFEDKKTNAYKYLENIGFDVVPFLVVNKNNISASVEKLENEVPTLEFGTDGLVLTYNSYDFSQSQGVTAKFPKHSIAFKWTDEEEETVLREVVWNTTRTGVINPVAVFDEIDLLGTIVTRASLHNVSIIEELELGIGDRVRVYKANMIIPQISENLTKSNNLVIPTICPCCNEKAEVKVTQSQKSLYCTNEFCSAKFLDKLVHFVARGRMNIDGLSEQTLEKFVNDGYIKDYSDIFDLEKYKDEIINKEGFGEKSYKKLIESINKSKLVPLENFISALGIMQVGNANAKLLVDSLNANGDINVVINASYDDILNIDGFGEVIAKSVFEYFRNDENLEVLNKILKVISFEKVEKNENSSSLLGLTFVITGSLEKFENRDELSKKITSLGGKVSGSVSKNTSYLINNDNMSNSSKNKKAQELNVPIITEDEFIEKFVKE